MFMTVLATLFTPKGIKSYLNHLIVLSFRYGDILSYGLNPRAKIFRREQGNVLNMDQMKRMMQWNKYETDPFSEGNAGSAIAARFDLVTSVQPIHWLDRGAHGAFDSKVTSFKMSMNMESWIYCGPTKDDQPPFSWDGDWAKISHLGLPHTYDFDWVNVVDF
jgi:hypothetical protein